MKSAFKTTILALSAVALLAGAGAPSADTRFQADHSRREQVNERLAHQSRRIAEARREGELTRGQAHVLRVQDRHIRKQERLLASRQGGRITKAQQHRLNREETRVGRRIPG
jgi:hypothetical protein